jgi:DNA-binding NtrC family response regulator
MAQTTLPDERGEHDRGEEAHEPHLVRLIQCESPLLASARHTLERTDVVVIGRGESLGFERGRDSAARRLHLRVPDPWMSTAHCQLVRVLGGWVLQDTGSRNGTLVNGEAAQKHQLEDGDVIEAGHTLFLFRELPGSDAPDVSAGELAAPAPGLLTLAPGLARLFAALPDVARSKVSVTIHGASGTGKELVARAVHALSGRGGAYIAVNCGALPESLVEGELFGHRKGAFSGAASDREGLVRAADRGTLFLDEIGDLPLASQAALLRVLQEEEVMPLGATRAVPVDLRVVAATHQDLPALVAAGRFRADLWARLSGFRVDLPPLADRREDLGIIIADLLQRLAPDASKVSFAPAAARALARHDWPLNIRELEKALAAALALGRGGKIELQHLPGLDEPPPAKQPVLSDDDQKRRDELKALLAKHDGNVSAVARELGKARMQIQRWIKRYGLK